MSLTYYKHRQEAYIAINEMVEKGLEEDVIVYKIQTAFGYGRKFVKERLELIEAIKGRA